MTPMGLNCLKATERLQGDGFLYFSPFNFQKFLVFNWSTLEEWKTELTLEPPGGIEPETPGLVIQYLNH